MDSLTMWAEPLPLVPILGAQLPGELGLLIAERCTAAAERKLGDVCQAWRKVVLRHFAMIKELQQGSSDCFLSFLWESQMLQVLAPSYAQAISLSKGASMRRLRQELTCAELKCIATCWKDNLKVRKIAYQFFTPLVPTFRAAWSRSSFQLEPCELPALAVLAQPAQQMLEDCVEDAFREQRVDKPVDAKIVDQRVGQLRVRFAAWLGQAVLKEISLERLQVLSAFLLSPVGRHLARLTSDWHAETKSWQKTLMAAN